MHFLLIVDDDNDDDDETSNLKNKTLKIWAWIKNGGNDEKLDFKNKRSFFAKADILWNGATTKDLTADLWSNNWS